VLGPKALRNSMEQDRTMDSARCLDFNIWKGNTLLGVGGLDFCEDSKSIDSSRGSAKRHESHFGRG
jgi:hypothetical protein